MKIKIVTVGKLKEKYLKDGIAEYTKRISRFAKLEMIELTDEKTPDKASELENQKILETEGETLSSEEFSKQLEQASIKGYSTLTFIIGGSLGLAPVVKNRANLSVSFGRLTLPHQLMRLVLVEQIYRAFTIQQGSPYHK